MATTSSAATLLAALLEYPDAASWRGTLDAALAAAADQMPDAAVAVEQFARAVDEYAPAELQELYVETFDLNPETTLDVGWHLFGDMYERGAFLADLRAQLHGAGIAERGELPDYLPNVVALVERSDSGRAATLREQLRLAVDRIEASLTEIDSPYVHVVTGLRAALGLGG